MVRRVMCASTTRTLSRSEKVDLTLPIAVFAAGCVLARLCRSKEILKIHDTAFDALVKMNAIPV